MNFALSRIPALFCNLQSEYGCHQARSYGGQHGNATPNSKVFRLNQIFEVGYKPKKYFSAYQRNCLKEPVLFQLLVEQGRKQLETPMGTKRLLRGPNFLNMSIAFFQGGAPWLRACVDLQHY